MGTDGRLETAKTEIFDVLPLVLPSIEDQNFGVSRKIEQRDGSVNSSRVVGVSFEDGLSESSKICFRGGSEILGEFRQVFKNGFL